jgi:hypothetical protein
MDEEVCLLIVSAKFRSTKFYKYNLECFWNVLELRVQKFFNVWL